MCVFVVHVCVCVCILTFVCVSRDTPHTQHFLEGAPLERCLALHGAVVASVGVSVYLCVFFSLSVCVCFVCALACVFARAVVVTGHPIRLGVVGVKVDGRQAIPSCTPGTLLN